MPALMTKPSYKIIETETTGEVHIKINSQYNHINAAKVVVADNITARLFGTVSELLIVGKGARIYFHGTVTGKIENEEGELFILSLIHI